VVDSCKHSNEPLDSIKAEECLDYLSMLLASQEGLYLMDLVLVSQKGTFKWKQAYCHCFPLK
jgi:hypothetical protein